jgi:profilin
MKHIADILNDAAGAKDKAFAEGLYISGERYVVARVEGRSLYARKVCDRV